MKQLIPLILLVWIIISCKPKTTPNQHPSQKIKVIFDTDANNELDDQHALAYLLFNGNTFDIAGVTVNATKKGGDISQQYAEARRVMQLCNLYGKIPLLTGANGSFKEIQNTVGVTDFDGAPAVRFIIEQADKPASQKLVVLAVGKLTNLALALKKEPEVSQKIRLVWLGSNYPDPGEYNQDNDTVAMNYILKSSVDFEMVTVRYGKPTGSGAVQVTKEEIENKMPGTGPKASSPVVGRHGGTFDYFGDYSISLFDHVDYHGGPSTRALFDMVAVAIIKHPGWGHLRSVACPILINNQWVERPGNPRKIIVWENFDKESILKDFFSTMDHYALAVASKSN